MTLLMSTCGSGPLEPIPLIGLCISQVIPIPNLESCLNTPLAVQKILLFFAKHELVPFDYFKKDVGFKQVVPL